MPVIETLRHTADLQRSACTLHDNFFIACNIACLALDVAQPTSLAINFLVVRVKAELPDHEPTGDKRECPESEVHIDAADLAHDFYA